MYVPREASRSPITLMSSCANQLTSGDTRVSGSKNSTVLGVVRLLVSM